MDKIKINQRLKISCIATIVTGLIAHMFIYSNAIYGLDNSLISFDKTIANFSGGKWLLNLCNSITLFNNLPWLSGTIFTFIMCVSVYMLLVVFDISNTMLIWMVAGVCQVSPTIIGANTYGSAYVYGLALLFAVCAVFVFFIFDDSELIKKILLSALFVMISTAIYGSYIMVTASTMLLLLLVDVISGRKFQIIVRRGMDYLLALIVGLVGYYGILRILLSLSSQQLNEYGNENTISSMQTFAATNPIKQVLMTYVETFEYYYRYSYTPHIVNIVIVILIVCMSLFFFYKKATDKKKNILVSIIIIALLPIALNFIRIFTNGTTHYLMYYSFTVPYLFGLKLSDMMIGEKSFNLNSKIKTNWIIKLFGAMMSLYVFYGFILANTAYIRMNNYYVETVSVCNRILTRIENCDGFTGYEDVILIWNPSDDNYIGKTGITSIPMLDGLWNVEDNRASGINDFNLPMLMNNILGSPLTITYCSNKEEYVNEYGIKADFNNELADMKAYPDNSCVKMIDGKIIVVLSDYR